MDDHYVCPGLPFLWSPHVEHFHTQYFTIYLNLLVTIYVLSKITAIIYAACFVNHYQNSLDLKRVLLSLQEPTSFKNHAESFGVRFWVV